MKDNNDLLFANFREADIKELTQIMERAFNEDSRRHLNKPEGGPPGYNDGRFLKKYGLNPASTAYRILLDGKVIGGLILWINKDNINFLGTVFLDPGCQDRGLGRRVWDMVEKRFPETKIWRTETPGFSTRNHHFYVNKCGFKIVRIEKPFSREESSYLMEKVMMQGR